MGWSKSETAAPKEVAPPLPNGEASVERGGRIGLVGVGSHRRWRRSGLELQTPPCSKPQMRAWALGLLVACRIAGVTHSPEISALGLVAAAGSSDVASLRAASCGTAACCTGKHTLSTVSAGRPVQSRQSQPNCAR